MYIYMYMYGINKYCMVAWFVQFLVCTCFERLLNSLIRCAHSLRRSLGSLRFNLAIFHNSCIKSYALANHRQ